MNQRLDKVFKLAQYKTSVKTEMLAGITTFVTMAYIMATIPNMMSGTGLDRGIFLTSMILLVVGTTVAMGIFTNRPFALGPGLNSVAVVAGMIVGGTSPSVAAGVIFWGGVLFVVISYVGLRDAVIKAIPSNLKHAVSASVGMLIALIGCRSAGLVTVLEGKNAYHFGDFTQPAAILALIGLLLVIIGKAINFPGYMIISILITTVIGIPMGVTQLPSSFFTLPSNPFGNFMNIDILGAFRLEYLPFFMALFMTDFFSTFGTAYGVGGKAGFVDKDGNMPGIDRIFKVDAISTVVGSFFCMPCMTTYLESSAGVEAGGRTGLTSLSTGLFFALSLLLTPVALMVPAAATAPALIVIGIDMLAALRNVDFKDFSDYFPAVGCVAFTLISNSIADGICVSILLHTILKLVNGKAKELSKLTFVLVAMALLYFFSTMVL